MKDRDLAMKVDEVLLEQETGHIAASFSLEFSQRSSRGFANSPRETKRLNSFLNSSAPGLFILLMLGDQQLGRAAIFLSGQNPKVAYLGCFDSNGEQRVTDLVLEAAIKWAKRQGVQTVYGPVDKNTWFTYRFRTDQNAETFDWEPPRLPAVYDAWRSFGFQAAASYRSEAFRQKYLLNMRLVKLLLLWPALKAKKMGYEVVPFHSDWKENLPSMHSIACDAFDGTFLFEPISYAEFYELYAPLGQKLDFRPSFFLLNSSKEVVGFILAFYEGDSLIIKSLGVINAHHGRGLGRALSYAALKAGADDGMKAGVAALFRKGNQSGVISDWMKKSGVLEWSHEYELLAYAID